MSSAIFRTGLRAPHVVLAGALVPVGTVLVTPALDEQIVEVLLMSIINVFYCCESTLTMMTILFSSI